LQHVLQQSLDLDRLEEERDKSLEALYEISCVQILPLGSFVLGVYARNVSAKGGKWHGGEQYAYEVMLHALHTGKLIHRIPF